MISRARAFGRRWAAILPGVQKVFAIPSTTTPMIRCTKTGFPFVGLNSSSTELAIRLDAKHGRVVSATNDFRARCSDQVAEGCTPPSVIQV